MIEPGHRTVDAEMSDPRGHEDAGETPPRETPPRGRGADLPSEVTISGNPVLAGGLAFTAGAIGTAYAGRGVAEGGAGAWLTAAGLLLLSVVWIGVLIESVTPRVVLDAAGVRMRFGREWVGLRWRQMERIYVRPPRSWLEDGRLSLVGADQAPLASLGRGARLYAAATAWLLGETYAVRLSWATRLEGADGADGDLVDAVRRLRDEAPLGHQSAVIDAAPAEAGDGVDEGVDDEVKDGVPDSDESNPVAPGIEEPDLQEPVVQAPAAAATVRPGLAARVSTLAHRFERPRQVVSMSVRTPTATDGTGALDLAPDRAEPEGMTQVIDLPEIDELRRDESTLEELTEVMRPLPRRGGGSDGDLEVPGGGPPGHQGGDAGGIGATIAAARLRYGLSVAQLAERTRIRRHVIEAIESDDFGPCGGDFYARGHLRTLARVLGIDGTPLLEIYDADFAHAEIDARQIFAADLARQGSLRPTRGGARWSVLVSAVMALILAWSIVRLLMDTSVEVRQPAPVLNGSAGPNNAPVTTAKPVKVRLRALRGVRVVVTDGKGAVVFRGDLSIEQRQAFDVVPPVRVSASEGDAVRVAVAGVPRGALGATAEPAEATFVTPDPGKTPSAKTP
ncbi:MAG: helix-turn-helix domain-containing protein, partial [Nocardioides sp.]